MSEQPFTAGPWRISAAIRGRHERVISAVGTPPLARTYYAKGGSSEANARLIAAAPAMYEALKLARKTLVVAIAANVEIDGFDPSEHLTIKAIDAALSQAEGRDHG